MFGLKYSLSKFSIKNDRIDVIEVNMHATFSIYSKMNLGSVVEAELHGRGLMQNKTLGVRQIRVMFSPRTGINCKLGWTRRAITKASMLLVFASKVYINSRINLKSEQLGAFSTTIAIGKKTPMLLKGMLSVENIILLGKKIKAKVECNSSILGIVELDIVIKELLVLNVSIPPQAEIRIDSKEFNVFLNNENIIYTHSGDWVELDRKTRTVQISTANNANISGVIVYEERYL